MGSQLKKVSKIIGIVFVGTLLTKSVFASDSVLDLGDAIPSAASVKEGLFPEDTDCMALIQNGFKCMNFKPPIRYSIPATAFELGSAKIPDGLKPQLNVFAEVLSSQRGDSRKVIIKGHADASGSAELNDILSEQRAHEVKKYLVARGADPMMLETEGAGSRQPLDKSNPLAAKNRRVEIGRLPQ